ncbi:uncharacterized protein [Palaemon carinicauda]|uniref:uncharacterized protein n=1 Tax=Palaemon carinicauda TaxID=392227 RepID=UPI0035B5DBD8
MYAHQPDKKEYEFGFKRGNGYHNVERYEKGGPHHNFKTKVRWHDAKGGHGEHYWDYNHAPKYHDDHHDDDHHGDHHDDHHNDYHGDDHHHGGGHGYGGGDHHDHHDDHGGYHSHPVPEYVPVVAEASRRSLDTSKSFTPVGIPAIPVVPGIAKREGIAKIDDSKDGYRPRERITKRKGKGNKVGVDKESGLEEKDKKKFQTKSDKEIREYASSRVPSGGEESPSAFPALLGFNPYLPPDIVNREFLPEGLSPSLKESVISETTSTASPLPSSFGQLSGFQDGGLASSSGKGSEAAKAKEVDKMPTKASSMSTLSFDLESGRIYDEESGVWYSLIPVKE